MFCPPFRLPVPLWWFLANLPGHVINASQDQLLVIEGHPAEDVGISDLFSSLELWAPESSLYHAQVTSEPGQSACSFCLPGSYAIQGVEKAKEIEEAPCCRLFFVVGLDLDCTCFVLTCFVCLLFMAFRCMVSVALCLKLKMWWTMFRFYQLHRLSEEHCGCCTRCWKLRCLWCRVPNWGDAMLSMADSEAIRLTMILISQKGYNDMKIHEHRVDQWYTVIHKWLSHKVEHCQTMGSSTCTRCGLGTYRTCHFVWPCKGKVVFTCSLPRSPKVSIDENEMPGSFPRYPNCLLVWYSI